MWLLAVSLTLYSIYLFGSFGAHLPFWFMIVELVCWSIALSYHYFPRDGGWSSNRVRKAFQEAGAHQKRWVWGDLNCAYDTSRDAYNGGEVWPDYEPWKPEQK